MSVGLVFHFTSLTSIGPTVCRIPMSEYSLVYGTARLAEFARISVKLGDQSITTHNGLPGKDNVSRVMSSVSWTPFKCYITQWGGGGVTSPSSWKKMRYVILECPPPCQGHQANVN